MAGELLTLDEQFFLRIALKNELISQGDADECLRLRAALGKRGKQKPLQEIMLDTGLLTPEEVDEIHEAQNASQVVRLDSLYADGALKLGLTTREHLEAAFAEQRARRYQVRVGELLVDKGVMSSAQHRQVLMELLLSMKAEEKAYIQSLRLKKRLGGGPAGEAAAAAAGGEPPMSEAERIKSAMTEVGWRAPGAGATPAGRGASGAHAPVPAPPPAPVRAPAPAPEPAPVKALAAPAPPPAAGPAPSRPQPAIPPRPVRPPPGSRPAGASGAFATAAPAPAPAPSPAVSEANSHYRAGEQRVADLAPTVGALPMAPPQAPERPPSRPAPAIGMGGAMSAQGGPPSRGAAAPPPPARAQPQPPSLPTVFAPPPAGAASRGATAFESSSDVDLSLFDSRSDAISDDEQPAARPASAPAAVPPSGPLAVLGPGRRLVDSHGSDDFLADSADEENRVAIAPLPAKGVADSAAARDSVQQWLGLDTVAGDSSSEVPAAKESRRRPSSDDELPESFFASNVLAVKEEGRRSRDPDDDAEVEPLLPPPPVSTPLPFVPAPAPTSLAAVPEPSLAPRAPSGRRVDSAYGAPPPRPSTRAPAAEKERPPKEREKDRGARDERREKPGKKDSGRQKAQARAPERPSKKKPDPAKLLESAIEMFDEQSAAATATATEREAKALATPDVQQVESDLTEVDAMIKAGAPSFSSLKGRRPSGERHSAFSTDEYLKRKVQRERALKVVLVALVLFVIAPTGAALWFAHENRSLVAEAREAMARGDHDAAEAAARAAGPFWIGERALERLRREVSFRRALAPVEQAKEQHRPAEALDHLRSVRDDFRDFGAETSALEGELTLAVYLDAGEKAEAEGDLAKAVASYDQARRASPSRGADAERRIAAIRARLEKDVQDAEATPDLERQVEAYRRLHAVFGGREEELGKKVLAFDLKRYVAQGDAASEAHDFEKALGLYYKAGEAARLLSSAERQREIEEKTRATRKLASFQSYFNKGQASEAKGKLDDALQSYRSALTWIEKGDATRLALVQQRIDATEKRKTREGVDAEAGRLWTEAVQALQQSRTDAAVAALEALRQVKADDERTERALAFAREVADMVYVPAGDFRMGTKAGAPGVKKEETPEHAVALPAYFIDRYETRNRSYLPFVEATGERRPEQWTIDRGEGKVKGFAPEYADHPVVNVSWEDAAKFSAWAKKRLPTEEEWERAARGGDGRVYPWGDSPEGAKANIGAKISERITIQTRPVGTSQGDVSPCGAVDMGGNVSEWTASAWAPYPGSEAEAGKFDGEKRVIRGGSWRYAAGYARCANRDASKPGERYPETGFRCVKEVPEWLTELR